MRSLKNTLIAAAAVLMFSIAGHAATFNVNTTADTQDANPGNGICADASGNCSLRAAITEANALAGNDMIILPAGIFTQTLVSANENNNAGGDWDFNSSISIVGAGAGATIVQANALPGVATERVFHIRFITASSTVTLEGMTIRHGRNTGNVFGAGVRVDSGAGTANFIGVEITNNLNASSGGGIAVSAAANSTVSITNSTITSNRAGSSTAGTSASGGGLFFNNTGNYTITGSTISGNAADSGVASSFGGGISIPGSTTTTISNSNITNNNSNSTFSQAVGGGIYSNTSLTINNSSINGNTATSNIAETFGGGITVLGGTTTINNSTLQGNTSISTQSNPGPGTGGGFFNQNGTLNLNDSVVRQNAVSRSGGGGVTLGSTGNATTNILRTSIDDNRFRNQGGGLVNVNLGNFTTTTDIKDSTISRNECDSVVDQADSPLVVNCEGGGIHNDSAGQGAAITQIYNATLVMNLALIGGAINNVRTAGEARVLLRYATITLNEAFDRGGALAASAVAIYEMLTTIIRGNTSPDGPDISGAAVSNGYNNIGTTAGSTIVTQPTDQVGANPNLGPLQNNGGPTETMVPAAGSPVINSVPPGEADCGTTVTTDQRGLPRPVGGSCDRGSVEVQESASPTPTPSPNPFISLEKTVGTTPGVCAPTNNISVPAGTTVYYCYTVTNTGDTTFDTHSLFDSQLGQLFSIEPFTLTPGSSVNTVTMGFQFSAVITSQTTNVAAWTAFGVGGNAIGQATAVVNISPPESPTPTPVPSISLTKTVGTTPGVCAATSIINVLAGTTVYYCYTVTNTGDIAFNLHSLTDDQLGNLFLDEIADLQPGASLSTVQMGFSFPVVINSTTTNVAVWTASIFGISAQAQASATVGVSPPESPTPTPTTVVQFTAPSYQDDESQDATIMLVRSGDLNRISIVRVNFTDGTAIGSDGPVCGFGSDYLYENELDVEFAVGEEFADFPVRLCGDLQDEPPETAFMALSHPSGTTIGTQGEAVLVINDTANQYRSTTPIDLFTGSPAAPYGTSVNVSGVTQPTFRIRFSLFDYYSETPDPVRVLLVAPNGTAFVIMGDAGGMMPIPPTGHVTLTFADYYTTLLPDNIIPLTGKYLATTWTTPIASFPAPAPPAPYAEPGSSTIRTVDRTFFGTFAGELPNGPWIVYVQNTTPAPLAFVQKGSISGGWGLELLPVTSAGVDVSGRVVTSDGRGLRNATVTMTDGQGVTRSAVTSSFGYYRFEGVTVGDSYVMTVNSRLYRFTPRVVTVTDTLTDVDFVGLE